MFTERWEMSRQSVAPEAGGSIWIVGLLRHTTFRSGASRSSCSRFPAVICAARFRLVHSVWGETTAPAGLGGLRAGSKKGRHIPPPFRGGVEIGCRRASQSAPPLSAESTCVKEKNGLMLALSSSKTEERLTRTIEWISVQRSRRLSGTSRYSRRVWSRRIGSLVRANKLMIGEHP